MRGRHCMHSAVQRCCSRFVFGKESLDRTLDGTRSRYERSGRNTSRMSVAS
jgi:hypothetical protein